MDLTIANDGVAPFYYDLKPMLDVGVSCTSDSATTVGAGNESASESLSYSSLGLENALEFRFYM